MFDTIIKKYECQCGAPELICGHYPGYPYKTPISWEIQIQDAYRRGFYDGNREARMREVESDRVRFASKKETDDMVKRLKEIQDSLGTPEELLKKLQKDIEV